MNELRSKFEDKGLSIIAVTKRGTKATDAWAKRTGCDYTYGYDPSGKLSSWFGIRRIPDAVLIDSNGTIVWRGNPGRLPDKMIRGALAGALEKPLWDWPPSAAEARDALEKHEYAAALAAAKESGAEFEAMVRKRIEHAVLSVGRFVAAGDYLRAKEMADTTLGGLKGLPAFDQMKEHVAALDTEDAQAVLAAQKKLRRLIEDGKLVSGKRRIKRMIATLEKLRDAHRGTIVEDDATWAIGQLDTRLRQR